MGEWGMKMDIRHIAKLARLEVSEQEAEQLGRDMEAILQLAGRLPADADAQAGLEAGRPAPLRPDVRTPSAALEDMLANAPEQSGGYLVVPKPV